MGPLIFFVIFLSLGSSWEVGPCDTGVSQGEPFCNTSLPISARVADILSRLDVKSKVGLLDSSSAPAEAVRLPFYEWWSEGLHGLALSAGVRFIEPTPAATSFPQILMMAATWNLTLVRMMAGVVSTEARAFNNVHHAGLTFWTPNINILRDPRWGRGQETPGEDPYYTSEYAATLMQALQNGSDPNYLKISGCCKHFVAYSFDNYNGTDRHHFNAIVNDQDLNDTYFPAFQSCIQRGEASGVMCSYNELNGVPTCASSDLLTTRAREMWGFEGYITSDCGAVNDVQTSHNYTNNTDDTVRDVLTAGMDLCCGQYMLEHAYKAYTDGAITEDDIDAALTHQLTVQMRLGMWDPAENQTYKKIGLDSIDTPASRQLALEAARQGVILLKNDGNILPLSVADTPTVAVIGPNGDMKWEMLGNYHGIPPYVVTPLEGFLSYTSASFVRGCTIDGTNTDDFPAAIKLAETSSATVLVMGLDQTQERENHDRVNITLPGVQNQLVNEIARVAKKLVVVIISGGAVDISPIKNNPSISAIVWMGYGGQSGGQGLADVIFGVYPPAGRFPMTVYQGDYVNQVNFSDMNMRPNTTTGSPGRTYRFFTGQTVYEFGYGLSYTTFFYSWQQNSSFPSTISSSHLEDLVKVHEARTANSKVTKKALGMDALKGPFVGDVSVNVTNTGNTQSDVVVLAFSIPPDAGQNGNPLKSLFGFEKINLKPGESQVIVFPVSVTALTAVNRSGKRVAIPGKWTLQISGPNQDELLTFCIVN